MGLFLKGIRLPGKLPTFDAVEAPLPKRVILPLRQYIGGPAGLTCAHYLARFRHSPTVLEAMPKLGGCRDTSIMYVLPLRPLIRK